MTRGGAEATCVRLARLSHCLVGILTSHPLPLPLGTPFKGQQGCLPKTHLLCTPSAKSRDRNQRSAMHQCTCRCGHAVDLSPLPALWHLLHPRRLSGSPPVAFCIFISGFAWEPLDPTPLAAFSSMEMRGLLRVLGRFPCCPAGRALRGGARAT